VPPEDRLALGIRDELVRLCLGIEETQDLIADLTQACWTVGLAQDVAESAPESCHQRVGHHRHGTGAAPHEFVEPGRLMCGDGPPWEAAALSVRATKKLELEVMRVPADRIRGKCASSATAIRRWRPAVLEREYHGLVRRISGVGYHEVIVESPTHNTCAALEAASNMARVFQAFVDRAWQVQLDPRIDYIQFFKNHGRQAGASLRHPHAQMMALPMVPSDVRVRADTARHALRRGGRVRLLRDGGAGIAPMEAASCWRANTLSSSRPTPPFRPFNLWVMPKTHIRLLSCTRTPAEVADLGKLMHTSCASSTRPEQPRFQLRDPHRAGARPGRALPALVHHHRAAHFAGRRLRDGQRHLHQPVAAGGVRRILRDVDE
jgi:hypothetical protein